MLSIGPDGCVTGPPVCQHDDLRYSSHFIDVDPTNRFVFVLCVAAVSLCRMFMHSYQSTDCSVHPLHTHVSFDAYAYIYRLTHALLGAPG